LLLGGCANLSYYSQAVGGHLDILRGSRPIDEWVSDPHTDGKLKSQLERVKAIRDFASRDLGLPDNGSYREYVDVGRPYVVWNVFATPEFSFQSEQWCMWVVGCVNYRGYYDQAEAQRFAEQLRKAGYDTYVGGVPAYSTLGYFNDPVLNTFLRFGDEEVARLIFHELAHQKVYAEGDSVFNESFASVVEEEGLRRWFAVHGHRDVTKQLGADNQRKLEFTELIMGYREKLVTLYRQKLPAESMRKAKAEVLNQLRSDYAALKTKWGGYSGYDAWVANDLNNAKMASLALYTQLVPALEALLKAEDADLSKFYRRAAALAKMSREGRRASLARLMPLSPKNLEGPVKPSLQGMQLVGNTP
jgi:predicted aminopeptidase